VDDEKGWDIDPVDDIAGAIPDRGVLVDIVPRMG
jgi:hypothetical protein